MTIENGLRMEKFELDRSLPTDIDLVEPIVEEVENKLEQFGWGEDSFFITVSLREALINGMTHGNLGIKKPEDGTQTLHDLAIIEQEKNPTKKRLQVVVKLDKERVYMRIHDEGAGFNPADVPDPLHPDNILKGSGRGIFMMRNFFDSVTHNEKGNEVTMVKTKKKEGGII